MKFGITLLLTLAAAVLSPASAVALNGPARHDAATRAGTGHDTSAGNVTVNPVAGGVEISVSSDEAVEVTVWAITGQTVIRATAVENSVTRIDLPRGCYIVRAGTVTRRIAVA